VPPSYQTKETHSRTQRRNIPRQFSCRLQYRTSLHKVPEVSANISNRFNKATFIFVDLNSTRYSSPFKISGEQMFRISVLNFKVVKERIPCNIVMYQLHFTEHVNPWMSSSRDPKDSI
jgi:hypothetical protein